MQSELERELAAQLSLMQHKAVDPWPAFQTEFHFDFCCEHPRSEHRETSAIDMRWCEACGRDIHTYHRGRAWRADFAYPRLGLLIEIDGSTWTGGRHTRGAGYEEDARKNARAVELGYRTLRFSGGQVKSGEAKNLIGAALGLGT